MRRFCSKQLKYGGCREGGWHIFFLSASVKTCVFFFHQRLIVIGRPLFQTNFTPASAVKAKINPQIKVYLHTFVQVVSKQLQKSFQQQPRSRSSEFKAFPSLEKNRTLAFTFATPTWKKILPCRRNIFFFHVNVFFCNKLRVYFEKRVFCLKFLIQFCSDLGSLFGPRTSPPPLLPSGTRWFFLVQIPFSLPPALVT